MYIDQINFYAILFLERKKKETLTYVMYVHMYILQYVNID